MKALIFSILFLIFLSNCKCFSENELWQKTGDLPLGTVTALSFNPVTNCVFAGIEGKGIFRSGNYGNTWTEINNGITQYLITAIVITNNGTILAADNGKGVFRSSNNGDNWTLITSGITNTNILTLAQNNSGQIFAGAWFTGSAVFATKNNGDIWENIGLPDIDTKRLFSHKENFIIAGTTHYGAYRTVDYGKKWDPVGLEDKNFTGFASNSKGEIFAATIEGLFKSVDDGSTWTEVQNGGKSLQPRAILITPSDAVFISTLTGTVIRSTDNCKTWQKIQRGMKDTTYIQSFTLDNDKHIYAGSNMVYRTKRAYDAVSLSLFVTPSEKQTLDWEKVYSFSIKVTDELDNPIDGASVQVIDNLKNNNLVLTTKADGTTSYTDSIPDAKPQQEYSITFKAIIGATESDTIFRIIEVKHIRYLHLTVEPDKEQVLDTGQTVEFKVSVKDDDGNAVSDADINIGDRLQDTILTMKTDTQGEIKYRTAVPIDKPNEIYTISFLASKEGFANSEPAYGIVRVQITDVEENTFSNNKHLISIYPNPSSEKVIFKLNLKLPEQVSINVYDNFGEEIFISYNNFLAGDNSVTWLASGIQSGFYFYKIMIGKAVETGKIILLK